MATTAQLGYGRITKADGSFTFTSQFDLNDQANTWLLGRPKLTAPDLKVAYVGNMSVDGEQLSQSALANRTMEFPIRLKGSSTDNVRSRFSDLLKALTPSLFVPADTSTYTYSAQVKWQPNGASAATYYAYFRSQPPALFDGSDLNLYRLTSLYELEPITVLVTCNPIPRLASVAL